MRRGLLAEFDSVKRCTEAIGSLKERGLDKLDVYMPYPDKEVQKALDVKPSPLPKLVFVAGLVGAAVAYFILWYTTVHNYPINVAGRPSHAVPAFIPITFETLVLFAGITSFVGSLVLGGMPRLYHPVDELEGFELVSVDRFIVGVDASNDRFDRAGTRSVLEGLGALTVRELGDLTSSDTDQEKHS